MMFTVNKGGIYERLTYMEHNPFDRLHPSHRGSELTSKIT
jgi:hypothetical protein